MPELPEAETIVRGIRPTAVGRRIDAVEIVHRDVLLTPARRLARGLSGRRIAGVGRRAKNILIRLDDDSVIWINLGMTGAVLPLRRPSGSAPARRRYGAAATHPTVVFGLDDGVDLVFDDSRRFGTVQHLDREASAEHSAMFGPEPLEDEFTADGLWQALRTSRSPVRNWLLDQRRVAGVGNIYANEALWIAGIHPARPARGVRLPEAAALHAALRDILAASIRSGGTTIRDYRNAEGGAGEFVRQLKVYDREGSPCRRCRTSIRRLVLSGRSAFFCPACQPRRGRPGAVRGSS